ncbi:MAG: hypothetical protein UZ21_OP11001000332 [Microgenomates bacterium OLB22]|nr:MAG: hypothetical protein UZ21_OP11001000332 [Microgenomates bacterium OLB22]
MWKPERLLQRVSYLPYGTSDTTAPTDRLYTSQRRLEDTNLYHYKSRFYSPELGLFIQPDTVEKNADSYGYVHGNPITYNDPTGNCASCKKLWNFISGVDEYKEKAKIPEKPEEYAHKAAGFVNSFTGIFDLLEFASIPNPEQLALVKRINADIKQYVDKDTHQMLFAVGALIPFDDAGKAQGFFSRLMNSRKAGALHFGDMETALETIRGNMSAALGREISIRPRNAVDYILTDLPARGEIGPGYRHLQSTLETVFNRTDIPEAIAEDTLSTVVAHQFVDAAGVLQGEIYGFHNSFDELAAGTQRGTPWNFRPHGDLAQRLGDRVGNSSTDIAIDNFQIPRHMQDLLQYGQSIHVDF